MYKTDYSVSIEHTLNLMNTLPALNNHKTPYRTFVQEVSLTEKITEKWLTISKKMTWIAETSANEILLIVYSDSIQ